MTKPDKKKRVRVNRDATAIEYVVPEIVPEIVPEPEIAPEPEPEEVSQPLELSIEPELDKLMDESSCLGNCEDPTTQVRKTRKPSAPKPLINEKNEYLNPRTNRYVKCGTSAFKQLVKDGVIVIEEAGSV